MIASLTGTIQHKTLSSLILDVHGVGYEVFMGKTKVLPLSIGQELTVFVYTHMTENSLQLFGFLTLSERDLFQRLISISGVGPKLGIAMTSALPYEVLIGAILQGDVKLLTSISGVGKKIAERLVIELRDKFRDLPVSSVRIDRKMVTSHSRESDAVQALVSLGYNEVIARRALQGIEILPEDTVQTVIKKSLTRIST